MVSVEVTTETAQYARNGETYLGKGIVRYKEWMDALIDSRVENVEIDAELDKKALDKTVREALAALGECEREIAERRFLMGQSLEVIRGDLDLSQHEVERRLREVIIKLRRLLGPFVRERFNINPKSERHCPLCEFGDTTLIEEIIATKKKKETWRRIMAELEKEVGVRVSSPQVLIGHVKYHLRK